MLTLTAQPGPRWPTTRRRLLETVMRRGEEVLRDTVEAAQQQVVATAPVYGGVPGRAFDTPPKRWGDSGLRYRSLSSTKFFRDVVRTLAEAYGLPLEEPEPGRLREALAAPVQVHRSPHTLIVGFASRRQLDAATRYGVKILLRKGVDPNKDRHREQFLWWDWEAERWDTASLLALPDGTTRPLGTQAGRGGLWRGAIEAGAGYWADVEFGTETRQVPAAFVPGPDASLVQVYLGPGGVASVPLSPLGGGDHGAPAQLYLSRAAHTLAQQIRPAVGISPLARQIRDLVRADLGGP